MSCYLRQFAGPGLRECDGPIQSHHVVKQQTIKRNFPPVSSLAPDEVVRRRKRELAAALKDSRNLVRACKRHHDILHWPNGFSVPSGRWPDSVRAFAEEHGLGWALERAA